MRRDWSETEVALIVADYFDMLRKELAGEPLNKSEHRRRLMPLLDGRSKKSVEFKHQNTRPSSPARWTPTWPPTRTT